MAQRINEVLNDKLSENNSASANIASADIDSATPLASPTRSASPPLAASASTVSTDAPASVAAPMVTSPAPASVAAPTVASPEPASVAATTTSAAVSTGRPETSVVLSVRDLGKRIKRRDIIKGISFEVYAGEVFGFLGPNGAGKTTTIRMLVDLIQPTRGTVEVGGIDVHKHHNEALAQVGCIVENPELYGYLSGWENLEHFARMLPGVTRDRIREVTEIVGMDKRIHDKVKTYSLGMRQRLGIAQALLGRPQLLILDEPTNGLDPQGIKEMRLFIRELAATGLSVFVSSHMLSEIQLMCDRVAIISHGKIIAIGRVDELLKQYGTRVAWRLSPRAHGIAVLRDTPGVAVLGQAEWAEEAGQGEETRQMEDIGQNGQAEVVEQTGNLGKESRDEVLTQLEAELVPSVNAALVAAGVQVRSIEMKNPSLEDLFLSLTEGEHID